MPCRPKRLSQPKQPKPKQLCLPLDDSRNRPPAAPATPAILEALFYKTGTDLSHRYQCRGDDGHVGAGLCIGAGGEVSMHLLSASFSRPSPGRLCRPPFWRGSRPPRRRRRSGLRSRRNSMRPEPTNPGPRGRGDPRCDQLDRLWRLEPQPEIFARSADHPSKYWADGEAVGIPYRRFQDARRQIRTGRREYAAESRQYALYLHLVAAGRCAGCSDRPGKMVL